ncbi:MAG: hypothetical protein ABI813_08175 [Bacteroidota bacterium]
MFSILVKEELAAFNVFGVDAKRLLTANLINALSFLFLMIFDTAFVKSITGGNNNLSTIYTRSFFAELIIVYYLNGAAISFISIITSYFLQMYQRKRWDSWKPNIGWNVAGI